MSARIAPRHLAAAGVIAVLAAALYVPFLGNPWVFDDRMFFSGGPVFYYHATTPLGLGLRLPPYFSLAMTETLGGSMQVHRGISLLLHVACALALYRLLCDLQRLAAPGADETDAAVRAGIVAAAFALHPVAVYGAGYLIQRSILFATLFSLLSLVLLLRGLRRGKRFGCDRGRGALLACRVVQGTRAAAPSRRPAPAGARGRAEALRLAEPGDLPCSLRACSGLRPDAEHGPDRHIL